MVLSTTWDEKVLRANQHWMKIFLSVHHEALITTPMTMESRLEHRETPLGNLLLLPYRLWSVSYMKSTCHGTGIIWYDDDANCWKTALITSPTGCKKKWSEACPVHQVYQGQLASPHVYEHECWPLLRRRHFLTPHLIWWRVSRIP